MSAPPSTALSFGLIRRPDVRGAPAPEQIHLQFGPDASRDMVVSWATPARVQPPRLRLGTASNDFGSTVAAVERMYVDAITRETGVDLPRTREPPRP